MGEGQRQDGKLREFFRFSRRGEFSTTGTTSHFNLAKQNRCLIPYRDVAAWRCEFFVCSRSRCANPLRTESNTANPMHGGGVTLAVLCRRAWDMAGGVP